MRDRLAERLMIHGSTVSTGVDDPLPLIDPGAAWFVMQGHVDIVAVTIARDREKADLQRTHLMRVEAGELILGFRAPVAGQNVLLLGFGAADGQVVRLPMSRLRDMADDRELAPEIGSRVDQWIDAVCTLCGAEAEPSAATTLRPGATSELGESAVIQPLSGVVWVRADQPMRFLGHEQAACANGTKELYFPLGPEAWLTAVEPCTVESFEGADVVSRPGYWRGLESFQDAVATVIDLQREHEREERRTRLKAKSRATRSRLREAFSELESILNRPRSRRLTIDEGNALVAACRLVGDPLDIAVEEPPIARRHAEHVNPLEEIARHSRFALRRVQLRGRWYRQDAGPLLGFVDDGRTPVALLPTSPSTYEMRDVIEGSTVTVTPAVARRLIPIAFTFYRCLPDRPLKGIDLLAFARHGIRRDVGAVAFLGGIAGLLALATPIAVGHVFDAVIPGAERRQIVTVTLGLVIAALATGAFEFVRNVALIRIKHRGGTALQAAVWQRLVHLPVGFFKKYAAGDLGVRAMGIDSMMDELSTATITTVVSSVFSLLALALLFWYSPVVAAATIAIVLVAVLTIIAAGSVQMRIEGAIHENRGKMAGMLLQLMHGISKIRIAAAEDRAFAQWSDQFAEQMRLKLRSRAISNNLDVLRAALPVLVTAVIFVLMARRIGTEGGLSTGTFLAFVAAFTMLMSGMLQFAYTVVDVLGVVPIYDRLRPILRETPEVDRFKADPGVLRGRIEVTNLTFRYESGGALILDQVDFHADPGEFVAIVGPSGSGKSTLMRILLGFETAESGAIVYDGFDAAGLDPHRLRRQIGVVLQDGDLLPGDIFTNIVGSAVDLTHRDAWEAARLAGLAADIEEMPMGMHTVVSEGAGTLSGGQQQRLMIARALVTRPRIVFFDEATSALDNPTQAIVTESLDRLRATRIVIAHRLSTIRSADRIYVLDNGRMVQEGTYESLVAEPGKFLDLVKRQMT